MGIHNYNVCIRKSQNKTEEKVIKNIVTMGKCAKAVGILFGVAAIALAITATTLEWLPTKPELRVVLEEIDEITLYRKTLPIISCCILCVSCLILLANMKFEKTIFNWLAVVGFIGAAVAMAYGGGRFVKHLVEVAAEVEKNPDDTQAWSDLEDSEMDEILDSLSIDSWGDAFNMVKSWKDLGLKWGWLVALISALVDCVVAGIFMCISCCGIEC